MNASFILKKKKDSGQIGQDSWILLLLNETLHY